MLSQGVAQFQRRKINYASKDVGTKKLAFFQVSMSGDHWITITCTIYFTVKHNNGKCNLATVAGNSCSNCFRFLFFLEKKKACWKNNDDFAKAS
jgi:hypothetical protein